MYLKPILVFIGFNFGLTNQCACFFNFGCGNIGFGFADIGFGFANIGIGFADIGIGFVQYWVWNPIFPLFNFGYWNQ